MSPRPHNLPSALSLAHNRCRISIMTPTSYNPNGSATFPSERPVYRRIFLARRLSLTVFRISLCPEVGPFTRFSLAEDLRPVRRSHLLIDADMSRENAIRSLAILVNERSENIFPSLSRSNLEINVVIFRTSAKSMKKKDGHAGMLSSKLRA